MEASVVGTWKARLLAQGFSQLPGIDYFETFTPVVKLDSLRFLCAIAAKHDLKLYQFDVVTAYLNGDLDTVLYTKPPTMLSEILNSIITHLKDNMVIEKTRKMLDDLNKINNGVCKLNKALYASRKKMA